jgi:hypothetical protein
MIDDIDDIDTLRILIISSRMYWPDKPERYRLYRIKLRKKLIQKYYKLN